MTRLAPAAATSRRMAWSLVTTTTGRSAGRGVDLGPDDVVGRHAGRRVDDPGQAPARGVGPDDVGAVEHDRDVGTEPPGQVVDEVEAAGALGDQVVVGPGQLGDVVPVDEHQRVGRPQQVLGRPAGVAGDPARQRQGDAPGRAGVDEPVQPVGHGPRRPGQLAQLGDLGAGHVDAAALGPVGEERIALRLGRRRPAAAPRRARARRRPGATAPPRRGRWRAGRPRGPRPTGPAARPSRPSGRRWPPRAASSCWPSSSIAGLQRQQLGAGADGRPARRPPAAARPAAARPPPSASSAAASAAATSSATRDSHPSSRRSHSMPIGSTSSGDAPADSRRRKSGSASIARRSEPSAPLGTLACLRNGFSAGG